MPLDIDDLERCAEKAGVWRAAILSLVAEVRDLRMVKDEHQMDNTHAYDEGVCDGILMERRGVVAYLRRMEEGYYDIHMTAGFIEKGDHHESLT
jgi:hypothetical protein